MFESLWSTVLIDLVGFVGHWWIVLNRWIDLDLAAVAQWLRASNIFRQICKSTSEWRGFESSWFYQSGFEFAKLHY